MADHRPLGELLEALRGEVNGLGIHLADTREALLSAIESGDRNVTQTVTLLEARVQQAEAQVKAVQVGLDKVVAQRKQIIREILRVAVLQVLIPMCLAIFGAWLYITFNH